MDPALFARLKKLMRAERKIEFEKVTGQPEWEWPGDEQALIEKYGEQRDLK